MSPVAHEVDTSHFAQGENSLFTWILLKKILSQMLSLRMIPQLTSALFLLAAKLSSQRFHGLLAWLKICRGNKDKTHITFLVGNGWGQSLLIPAAWKVYLCKLPWNYQKAGKTIVSARTNLLISPITSFSVKLSLFIAQYTFPKKPVWDCITHTIPKPQQLYW